MITNDAIASGLEVSGIGSAQYTFPLSDGSKTIVTLNNVLYVPACMFCLLCLRHMADCTGVSGDGINSLHDYGVLTCNGTTLTIPYHDTSGLPIIFGHPTPNTDLKALVPSALSAVPAKSSNLIQGPTVKKQNRTHAQHLKLLMHEQCNHRSMDTINNWIRRGLLPVDLSIASYPDPICSACQLGKTHQKSHASNSGSTTSSSQQPGDGASVDQLEAGHPEKIPATKGFQTLKRYKYCNILVDHHSHYIFPTFHKTKHASKLIQSIRDFQGFAAKYIVKIRRIRANNGVYSTALFQLSCEQENQGLSFCAIGGIGATSKMEWQNAILVSSPKRPGPYSCIPAHNGLWSSLRSSGLSLFVMHVCSTTQQLGMI